MKLEIDILSEKLIIESDQLRNKHENKQDQSTKNGDAKTENDISLVKVKEKFLDIKEAFEILANSDKSTKTIETRSNDLLVKMNLCKKGVDSLNLNILPENFRDSKTFFANKLKINP